PAAVDDAIARLHWVDDTFSTYEPDSPISRLARGEIGIAECPPEVAQILTHCDELRTETDGYFSAYATGSLDPSGLVKGWAIQQVSDQLRAAGSRNHCINGGGDVHCAGSAANGGPWRIGISHPIRPGQLAAVVTGTDIAVATSGTAERGAHIRNPHGLTAPCGLASVTIVGKDLGRTDAYATAAFAMGTEAPDWIATLDGYQGLVIRADGSQWASPDFASAP
ncbi:MAG: FAD:protein FMN transferase, partial [Actinobacteria bacterium]|nr:FAD:protein FMN transferase [Actinomycetota bacterium]